jgi:lipoate---protein ligase
MTLDGTSHGESWRLLPFHAGSSSLHFALSDALVRHSTEPTAWWHEATHPTLILGMAQRRSATDSDSSIEVEVVRRQSGGAAVYATAGVLGLDVALPVGHPLASSDVVEAYRWLGEVWVDATRALRVDSRIVPIAEARDRARKSSQHDPLQLTCFGMFSPYEVAVGSRKLVGMAQVRRRTAVLLQSAIHLCFDAATLARLIEPSDVHQLTAALRDAAVGLHEVAPGRPKVDQVVDAFHASLHDRLRIELRTGDWSDAEIQHVRKHYAYPLSDGVPA